MIYEKRGIAACRQQFPYKYFKKFIQNRIISNPVLLI